MISMPNKNVANAIFAMGTLMVSSASVAMPESQSGFRVGVGLAGEYMSVSSNMKRKFVNLGEGYFGNSSDSGKKAQISPSFEIGYLFSERFYLGLFTSWRHSDTTYKSRSPLKQQGYLEDEFTLSNYTNILLKLGYKINQYTMVYGGIGPSYAKWNHTTTQYFRGNVFDTLKLQKKSWGVAFSMGIEMPLAEQATFSVDYTHAIYRTKKYAKSMTIMENHGMGYMPRKGTYEKSIQPSHGTLALRVTYFF